MQLADFVSRLSAEQTAGSTMSRVVLILLVVIGIFSATIMSQHEQHECPENQKWNSCGSACPSTCGLDDHRPCTLECVIGCQCEEGYKLNSEGHCVTLQNC